MPVHRLADLTQYCIISYYLNILERGLRLLVATVYILYTVTLYNWKHMHHFSTLQSLSVKWWRLNLKHTPTHTRTVIPYEGSSHGSSWFEENPVLGYICLSLSGYFEKQLLSRTYISVGEKAVSLPHEVHVLSNSMNEFHPVPEGAV